MDGYRAAMVEVDENEVIQRTKSRTKVFKGEIRKSPLTRAARKIVAFLVTMSDEELGAVRVAELNRVIGEPPDHRGIWVLIRSIKERGLIQFSGQYTGMSSLTVHREKCAAALADPREPRRR